MRTNRLALVLSAFAWLLGHPPDTAAQSTAFTYQGRLQDGGSAPTGLYDFEFRLFNAASGGAQVGLTVTLNDLGVTNGLFNAALDFGANFPGADRFLQLSVRPGASVGAYSLLSPRQPITATPYAIRSLEAAGLPAGAVSGAMLANGAVTATKIAPGAVSQLGASDGSPVNAVQVNTNGLVGVGTNAPQAGLHIASSQGLINLELLSLVQDESGGYTNLSGLQGLASWGGYVAVASSDDSGVTLLRITNPASPQLMFQVRDGEGAFTGLSMAWAVAMSSNVIALATPGESAVTLIDWSNPTQPVKLAELRDGVGGWNELAGVRALALSGNLLAMAAPNDAAVTLADISNPAAPGKRAEFKDGLLGYTNLLGVRTVALSGSLLVIGGQEGVTLVDVANPIAPVKRAELRDGLNGYNALASIGTMALSGNLLAIGGLEGVTLVDVSNPSGPVRLGEWRGQGASFPTPDVSALAFSGGYLGVALNYTMEVILFSASASEGLSVVASAQNGGMGFQKLYSMYGLTFSGQTLVVGGAGSALNLLGLASRQAGLVSEGWVGIGTTRPAAALHVAGNVLVQGAQRIELNATNFQAGIRGMASGRYSTTLGVGTKASGEAATALGASTTASGDYSTALGGGSVAGGRYSIAGGDGALASGDYSLALGFRAEATNIAAVAIGNTPKAQGHSSMALGFGAIARGDYSVSLGYNTLAAGEKSAALGFSSQANHPGTFVWADSSLLESFGSTAPHQFLVRATGGVGINTTNTSGNALSVQGATRIQGPLTVTGNLGVSGTLSGNGGSLTQLNAGSLIGTVSDGRLSSNVAVRAGGNTFTGDQIMTAGRVGIGATSPATELHVKSSSAQAEISVESGDPLGRRWSLQSSGTNADAMLDRSFQIIDRSAGQRMVLLGLSGNVALGPNARAQGNYSTAMGYNTKALGNYTTALGYDTGASADGATAMGVATVASGAYSTAMGYIAHATHGGSFVWADASGSLPFASTATNQFSLRATGGVRLSDNTPGIFFGSTTRQMLNLWGTKYGIGVQSGSLYFRSDNFVNNGFIWYRGGTHSDAYADAGGGSELMHLTDDGLDVSGEIHWGASNLLSVNQEGSIELGNSTSTATTPFLDFHYGVAGDQDYNTRIINSGDQQLDITRIGSPIAMARFNSGGLTVNGTFVSTSDRNAKENFQPVDAQEVLNKVAALPLTRWNYKEDRTQRHLGPMAQDFQSAFGVGPDDKHIATVDADGVALAAIQGLHQKLRSEIMALRSENQELKSRLERLEHLFTNPHPSR